MDIKLILTAIVVVLAIILILVALLLYVKSKLSPAGVVTVNINDGKREVQANPGQSLLATLAEQKIFLPSACGGKGSCGMCKCQVLEGGGSILPTETGFFTYKQQHSNWRLGCQVKVKQNIKIKIPDFVLDIKKWECEVVSNRNVSTFIKEFVVKLPNNEHLDFIPGSYIQIDIPKYSIKYADYDIDERFRPSWDHFHMWDLVSVNDTPVTRAYSMANYPAEGDIVMLNVRIATPPFKPKPQVGFQDVPAGISSSYIFSLKPGDKVMISGPFGEFHPILNSKREMLYVGGGAGMAPLRAHILHLLKTLKIRDRKISYWYGARSLAEVFYLNDFLELEKEFPNFKFYLTLDRADPEADKAGVKYIAGFVGPMLYEHYLKNHEEPEDIEYYMCGPAMMAKSIEDLLDKLGVPPENLMFDKFG